MNSIFDLEKRFDFNINYNRLINLCDEKSYYIDDSIYPNSLWEVIDMYIRDWKYHGDACDIKQYLYDIGVDCFRGDIPNITKMYVLEFLLNIISYICDFKVYHNKNQYMTVKEHINFIVEKLNYQIYRNGDQLRFSKRNADVDSVLETFKNDEEVRLALLSYNDFRISNNAEEKKQILIKLGGWLEPKRKEFNGINHQLTEDVFFMLNRGQIRHVNDNQIEYKNTEERIDAYDMAFELILHLIRSKKIKEYQQIVDVHKRNATIN